MDRIRKIFEAASSWAPLGMGDPDLDVFAVASMHVPIKLQNTVPTAALRFDKKTKKFEIHVNPDFIQKITQNMSELDAARLVRGILKHELLHYLLQHWREDPKRTNHELANIAMDAVINPTIKELKALPTVAFEDAVLGLAAVDGALISGSKLQKDPSWETLYDWVTKQLQDQQQSGSGSSDNEAQNDQQTGQKGKGKGQGKGSAGSNKATPKDMLADEIDRLSEEEAQVEAEKLANVLEEIERQAKNRGSELMERLSNLLKKLRRPTPVWKKILKKTLQLSSYELRGKNRPNKRYNIPPRYKLSLDPRNVMVFIDASASISSEELDEFIAEVKSAAKRLNIQVATYAFSVTLKEVDLTKKETWPSGGTDLNKAVKEALADTKFKTKFKNAKAIVILTDGYDDPPDPELFKKKAVAVIYSKEHSDKHEKICKSRGYATAVLENQ